MTVAIAETQQQAARKRIELHKGQEPIFKAKARFKALIAGTGGGKTFIGPYWLAKEIAKNPQGLFGVGAPTYKMLNRITAPELVKAFRGTDFEGEYKPSVGEYLLPTGGLIYLFSTDNPDHVEGGQYDAIWLDEAGQMKRWIWIVVQARLGFKQGALLLTTTPYGLNWLHTEIFNLAKKSDPDYFVSQFASTDNPKYPKTEFERARRTMDERTFAMRYMGEFRKMAGLVWPGLSGWVCQQSEIDAALAKARGEDGDRGMREERSTYNFTKSTSPEHVNWVGGIDWGYNNPFVALSAFIDADDVLWLYRERCRTETLLKDHAPALDKQTTYYADPSGKQQIEEMIALDIAVQGAPNDVAMGIERVTERGKTGRLRISPECRNLISEAETYCYKEDTDKPVKERDHCCDSLRYMVMGVDGKPEPKIISLNFGTQEGETSDGEDIMLTEDPRYWRGM